MLVFNRSLKLFYLLILPQKIPVTNSVDMCKLGVFIGGTALTWLNSGIPCESSVSCSDEFLSLSEMLKYGNIFDHLRVPLSSLKMSHVH